MIAAHTDGEITFYEELGVAPGASPQEIRDAFRLFVRLLHPDQQTDPQLREFAEQQMRKLNRIYAVLSDPERRRSYDEGPGSSRSPEMRRLVARMAWAAAIALCAGSLTWLAYHNNASRVVQLRSELKAAVVERDTAIGELNKLRATSATRTQASQPRPALTITELPTAPKLRQTAGHE